MPPSSSTRMSRAAVRRMLYAIFGIGVVLAGGTVGFHLVAGLSAVDSFYYESMLATGQGPPTTLPTDSDKIFTSIMAFISVGSVVSTLLFAVGPVLRRFWREEVEHIGAGARVVEREFERHL